jgi:hypothetical protein
MKLINYNNIINNSNKNLLKQFKYSGETSAVSNNNNVSEDERKLRITTMINEKGLSTQMKQNALELMNEGHGSIIFDCETPKYLKLTDNNKNQKVSFHLAQLSKKKKNDIQNIGGYCDDDEKVWRVGKGKDKSYLIHNYSSNEFESIPSNFLYNLRVKSMYLCLYFLDYFKHPNIDTKYMTQYSPPIECVTREGARYWNEKIASN